MTAAYDETYVRTSTLGGEPFEIKLGVYLWRSSLTEQVAAGCFEKCARWDYLSAAEQAMARLFAQQERDHATLLKALGQEYIRERPDRFLRHLGVPDDPWTILIGVSQAERISFVGFEKMAALGRRLGHDGMVAAYERITREEREHLAWGRPLIRRIFADPRYRESARTYAKTHPIAREYRAVRQERPWT